MTKELINTSCNIQETQLNHQFIEKYGNAVLPQEVFGNSHNVNTDTDMVHGHR